MTAPTYEKLTPPKTGTRVTVDANGHWNIPDDPIVCLLRGDGIGRDVGSAPGITTCAVKVLDAAVAKAYGGKTQDRLVRRPCRRRRPRAVLSRRSRTSRSARLSEDAAAPALPARRHAQGVRVLQPRPEGAADHAHRRRLPQHQRLPAHALRPLCLRAAGASYFKGVEAPNKRADKVDMVIFRENTEDVYCGIEFKSGSDKAKKIIAPAQGDGLQRPAVVRASASSR